MHNTTDIELRYRQFRAAGLNALQAFTALTFYEDALSSWLTTPRFADFVETFGALRAQTCRECLASFRWYKHRQQTELAR